MEGVIALYIVMLAAFTGYEIIAKVPVILHTPLMSGSNFVHGIVLVGAMGGVLRRCIVAWPVDRLLRLLVRRRHAGRRYVLHEAHVEMFQAGRQEKEESA